MPPKFNRSPPVPDTSQDVSVTYVALADVQRWHRNPKDHNLPEIIESLKRFGFTSPLIRDERTHRLVAGHGRLEALITMERSGQAAPARIKVDAGGNWYVPVLTGVSFESDEDAEAYLLADNQLVTLGKWNDSELEKMLADIGNLAGTGFSLDVDEREINAALAVASRLSDDPDPDHEDDSRSDGEISHPPKGVFAAETRYPPATRPTAPPVSSTPTAAPNGARKLAPPRPGTREYDALFDDSAPDEVVGGQAGSPVKVEQAGDEAEQTPERIAIGDYGDGRCGTSVPRLYFNKHRIAFTQDESAAFEAVIHKYVQDNGTMHGFLGWLCSQANIL